MKISKILLASLIASSLSCTENKTPKEVKVDLTEKSIKDTIVGNNPELDTNQNAQYRIEKALLENNKPEKLIPPSPPIIIEIPEGPIEAEVNPEFIEHPLSPSQHDPCPACGMG